MAEKKKKIIRYFVVRREPYLAMNLNHILKRKHIESLCLILHTPVLTRKIVETKLAG